MDGYITIGTKLSTKDLEKELSTMKRDLSKYEKENELLLNQKAKLSLDTKEAEKKLEQLNREIDSNMEKQRALILQRDSIPEYQRQFDSTTYDNLNKQIISLQKEYDKYSNMHKKTLEDINKQESALGDINSKLNENAQAQNVIKERIKETTTELQNRSLLDNINNGLTGIISKVTKWGLALFGIRGAYSLISRSMSTLSQQDKNMASQIEYIRWALANTIAPVVKFIINAVYLILQLINKISRALFGFDLIKGPQEFASSMKKASGSAEKIRKSLAGFDEMNILGDNTTAGAGAGITTPTFDTANIDDYINKAKKKVKELEDYLRKLPKDVDDALANPGLFTEAYGRWDLFFMSLSNIAKGFAEFFTGIWDVLKAGVLGAIGLFTGNLELIKKGSEAFYRGIVDIFKGLRDIIVGIVGALVGTLKGLLLPIFQWINTHIIQPVVSLFSKAKDNIVKSWSNIGTKIGGAFDGLKKAVLTPINWVIDAINKLIKGINKIKIQMPGWAGGQSLGFNIKTIDRIKLAKGTILNNPGRGVPVANAIAGESGREAVLPLSDARLLEELGSTIGRYITINLTNVTELDGTTIARKMKNLTNNDNFLRNR